MEVVIFESSKDVRYEIGSPLGGAVAPARAEGHACGTEGAGQTVGFPIGQGN